MNDEAAWRSQFEQMGANQVRSQLNANRYSGNLLRAAINWLNQKDQEEARLKAASEAAAKEDAREANRIAAEANSIARAASRISWRRVA